MRVRIILGGVVVCLLLLVGLWSTAYFQVGKVQKEFITDLHKKGYEITFENVKTSGFPYQIKRTVEQIVIRSKDSPAPVYMHGGDVTMKVQLFQPSRMHFTMSGVKCTVDRTITCNIDSIASNISLDPTKKTASDTFNVKGIKLKKGDMLIASYPEMSMVRGIKNNSLFFETNFANVELAQASSLKSFTMKGYFDTPHKTWLDFNKAFASSYERLDQELRNAVRTGQQSLPLLSEWIETCEEQQIACHFKIEATKTPEDILSCSVDLGVVDAMPHGMIALSGEGVSFAGIKAALAGVANDLKDAQAIDFSIKSNGIFLGDMNLMPYQPVSWKNYPIVTEAIVCDTFKLYTHGEFRKARAENGKMTEDPNTQYLIGEGYLLDSQYEMALTWFKRAGLQHHPKALLHMAYHYFNGFGCEKNEVLAREFTEDAVCQGIVLNDALSEFTDADFSSWASSIVGENSPSDK